ncbi:MAG: hypothetical protein L6R39_005570 [Caloplaca ligustica]|nr:MAG: hypothetical protein L6R39_005570 [Caloplaca ligustica]
MRPSTPFPLLAVYLFSTLTTADEWTRLTKPALVPNLDYLHQGLLDHYPSVHSRYDIWGPGWIPQDCLNMAKNSNLNPADVLTYNVNYDDCSTAWVLCYHKNSHVPFDAMVDLLGRVPVASRQFVRHVIALPDTFGHAYNSNGNLAMFDITGDNLAVYLHETAHSLDFQNAYNRGQMSNNQNWIDNYNQDPNVPDPYSATNSVEDVAQNTVVAAFNRMVPGGYGSIEPQAGKIFHQYATVDTWQRESGNLLVPGGQCWKRLANSAPVPIPGQASKLRRGVMPKGKKPDVSLAPGLEIIEPKEFHTEESCKRTYGKGAEA